MTKLGIQPGPGMSSALAAGGATVAISANGLRIAYISRDSTRIARVWLRDIGWAEDGYIYFTSYSVNLGIQRVRSSGGASGVVSAATGVVFHDVSLMPDGKFLLAYQSFPSTASSPSMLPTIPFTRSSPAAEERGTTVRATSCISSLTVRSPPPHSMPVAPYSPDPPHPSPARWGNSRCLGLVP